MGIGICVLNTWFWEGAPTPSRWGNSQCRWSGAHERGYKYWSCVKDKKGARFHRRWKRRSAWWILVIVERHWVYAKLEDRQERKGEAGQRDNRSFFRSPAVRLMVKFRVLWRKRKLQKATHVRNLFFTTFWRRWKRNPPYIKLLSRFCIYRFHIYW